MRILIKNGRLLDPGKIDQQGDLYVVDGKIAGLLPDGAADGGFEADREIDATGCLVTPGLIDMHVHLREPGHEYKETIESGVRAAAAGGFTAVCSMPNTKPVNDNAQITRYIRETAEKLESVRVYPVGAISTGLAGDNLAEFAEMKSAGAIAVSDDGRPVTNSQLMRRALEYAKGIGLRVISHCEDLNLAGGVMNEGAYATRMGLSGIPNAAESVMVMRDIAICELTGAPVHIAHVSTRESIRAIRDAKKRGLPITAETAPHYFTLTDEAIGSYNTNAKMNPPLRSERDRQAVREGLSDGTIDVIATDHAPHAALEKTVEFDLAPNGIIGLETSLSLSLRLVASGMLDISQLIEKMAKNPARIIGKPCGLSEGEPADITVIDPNLTWRYRTQTGFSRSSNSPFDGWDFTGRAVCTIVAGRLVFEVPRKS